MPPLLRLNKVVNVSKKFFYYYSVLVNAYTVRLEVLNRKSYKIKNMLEKYFECFFIQKKIKLFAINISIYRYTFSIFALLRVLL